MKKGGIYYVSNNLTLVATFYRNSLLTFGLLLSNSGNISCILKYIVYRSIIWERNTNIKQGHHLLCIFIAISLVSNKSLFSSSSLDIAFVYIS